MADTSEDDKVLQANAAFYRAFAARDLAAMENLWARQHEVACLHPGWGPLVERAAVMQSWQQILTNPGAPKVTCAAPRAWVFGELAFVICFEALGADYLIATNIFAREDGQWRMVHHHAGPTTDRPREPESPPKKTVH
ncbi:MAG: nuclear transport factor 2 family protein [Alphaproteobacteria bacterium]